MNTCYFIIAVCVFVASYGVFILYNSFPGKWFTDDPETEAKEIDARMQPFPGGMMFCLVCAFFALLFYDPDSSVLIFLFRMLSFWIIAMIFISDLKTRIVPDQMVAGLTFIAVCWATYDVCRFGFSMNACRGILLRLAGGLAGSLLMLLISIAGKHITGKDALGMGDVKYFFACGLITGIDGLLALVCLSFLTAFPFSAFRLVYTRLRHIEDSHIPFAPFISIAVILFILFPDILLINCIF